MSLPLYTDHWVPLMMFFNQKTPNTSVDYLTTPKISLILQVLILLGLILGYLSMKQKRLTSHSYIMFILYLVHVLSVLIFMRSSALNILRNIPSTTLEYITALHGTLGIITLALSTYVILGWRFQKTVTRCYKMKGKMKILTILWVAVTLIGVLEYYIIYMQ